MNKESIIQTETIDIAIAVNKQELDSVSKQLQSLGYEFKPTFSTTDRLYFITPLPDPEEETRRYHIHLTYPENSEWKEFIGFRDYLRNHPKELQEYAEIKKQAAFEANHEGERYRKIKEPIFKKINSLINKTNFKALIAILTFYGWMGTLLADQEKIVYQVEYLYPVDDDSVIPLPFITLRGKLIRHTFPGVPNYESIEDGDYPETRWVLVIPEAEIKQLITSRSVSEEMYGSCQEGWVQLIAADTEESPQPFLNKQIVVKGYLGTLASHIHTLVTIEAKEIYEDSQKMD